MCPLLSATLSCAGPSRMKEIFEIDFRVNKERLDEGNLRQHDTGVYQVLLSPSRCLRILVVMPFFAVDWSVCCFFLPLPEIVVLEFPPAIVFVLPLSLTVSQLWRHPEQHPLWSVSASISPVCVPQVLRPVCQQGDALPHDGDRHPQGQQGCHLPEEGWHWICGPRYHPAGGIQGGGSDGICIVWRGLQVVNRSG